MMMLRSVPGLNPLVDFRSIKDYNDVQSMLRDVIQGQCIAAIPRNTLSTYRVNTNQVKALATTAEVPYGAVLVSSTISASIATRIINVLGNTENADLLKDYANYKLLKATNNDFAGLLRFFDSAGMNAPNLNVDAIFQQAQ
jgi:ABC-type phosphate/phosphonate transport system substrate-binding protein